VRTINHEVVVKIGLFYSSEDTPGDDSHSSIYSRKITPSLLQLHEGDILDAD
jgi:hypothetical protein